MREFFSNDGSGFNYTNPASGFIFYKSANPNNNFTFYTTDSAAGFSTAIDGLSVTFNTPYIVTGRRAALLSSLYKNGTRVANLTVPSFGPNTSAPFRIGCQNDGTIHCFDGQISEIIMYSRALKIEERRAVESYLGKKYAISVSFVTGQ